ncbi:MAG: hypothetical protein FWJ85_10865 [Solitalea sp.]
MKIGIIPDRAGEESYSEKWQEFIKKAGHQVEIIPLDANNLNRLRSLDGIMWRFKHLPDEKRLYHILSNYAEKILKIPIFPDSPTAWHYDEKIAQHFLFAGSPFPFIEGFLFFSYGEAMEWIASHPDYPLVHKLSSGAGAANVSLIRNRAEAEEMARRMFQEGVYPYSMAYDFLFNAKGEPEICEISYTYLDRYVYNCPGHWNGALAWIEGHMWPEEAQVQDFINLLQTR